MHASDLLVTKPGGLTVSEALACGVPLAVFDAIPGQEEENADFLLSNDMAVKLEPGKDCGEVVRELLDDTRHMDEMRGNCAEFDKSSSARDILELTRTLCGKYAAARGGKG
jgi:processive 1,2-diacylglycerol beta-glucosyltransferase